MLSVFKVIENQCCCSTWMNCAFFSRDFGFTAAPKLSTSGKCPVVVDPSKTPFSNNAK
jgi:hypothetical protein